MTMSFLCERAQNVLKVEKLHFMLFSYLKLLIIQFRLHFVLILPSFVLFIRVK